MCFNATAACIGACLCQHSGVSNDVAANNTSAVTLLLWCHDVSVVTS